MPYLLFLKKKQNLKLSSAANYRWPFKVNLFVGVNIVFVLILYVLVKNLVFSHDGTSPFLPWLNQY